MNARFCKLDDAGNELSPDATSWSQVLDRDTNLIWTADNAVAERLSWSNAKEAVAACSIGNATDWRLPTVKELVSIVDYEREDPAIQTDFFRCKSNWYWSASPCAWAPGSFAWFVYFYDGSVDGGDQDDPAFVRAVRSASVPGQ
jgi:hypothetical protein